jgi:3-oxoacyl-[acyl-carrier protein] reductase
MGKLDGKITLVAGGAGYVGEGIVRAFLKEGATVAVSARNSSKLEELRGLLGELASDRFVPVVGEFSQIEAAEHLRDEILNKFGRLDAVVASLGGGWKGNQPLTKVSMEDWQNYLQSNLTTHFVAARTFLPVLAQQKGSSYTLLGGGAAETAIPNYSLIAIPAAGSVDADEGRDRGNERQWCPHQRGYRPQFGGNPLNSRTEPAGVDYS